MGFNYSSRKELKILFYFIIITLCLYYPTIDSGFTTDVTGGIERLSTRPLKDILISFGFPALNQLSVALFYIQYQLFGTNGFGWYLVYGGLHSFNAFLLYLIFKELFTKYTLKSGKTIALIGALLFLISPYQSEVLVWKACQNYLLSVCFIFCSLLNLIWFLSSDQKKHLYSNDKTITPPFGRSLLLPFFLKKYFRSSTMQRFFKKNWKQNKLAQFDGFIISSLLRIHVFFLLALFTFEYGMILPFLILILLLFSFLTRKPTNNIYQQVRVLILPQILALGGYFMLMKILFGTWIGHYGATVHLNFPIKIMLANALKYLVKYLFFVRFYAHPTKTAVFSFIDNNVFLLIGLLLILILGLLFFNRRKKKASIVLLLLCSALFFTALLPVLNLYFYYLQYLINDRHAYLASAFLYMGIALLCFQLPKYIGPVFLIAYISISAFFLVQLNGHWQDSTNIYNGLMDNFSWYDAPQVVLLNVPDNYKGIYLYRIIQKQEKDRSGFEDALEYISAKNFEGQMLEVTQYNMETATDGVSVTQLTHNTLKVTFNQWGNWFWRNGIGAGEGYENKYYKVRFKGQWYELELKNGLKGAVFIYQDGDQWKEFEFKQLK